MRRRVRRGEARRARVHGVGDDRGHCVDLVVGRFPLLARVAHDVAAHRAVADVERGVDADATVERAQVLGERLEAVERDAGERGRIHSLDASEQLDQPVAVARPQRRDGEPAVAGDDRGDAVEAARRRVRLEGELRVVVRVRIDDPGGHHAPVRVDLAGATSVDEPDLGDPSPGHGHVGSPPREPRAVDDDAVADHQVVGGHCPKTRTRSSFGQAAEAGRYRRRVDSIMARKMWRTLEPYHGLVYFAPEASRAYATLGIDGRDGYFASRSAPMGAVEPSVVIAAFFNFNPELITHALPAAWSKAGPAAVVEARFDGVDQALRRVLGEDVGAASVVQAAELAHTATEGCTWAGRPLAAAHASLEWPTQPHVALWHAISVLREFRGDGHITCLVGAALDPVEALVLHAATTDVGRTALQTSRAWSDLDWDAAVSRLRDRGLVDEAGAFTDDGDSFRQAIEDRTDLLAMAPWLHLGEEGCNQLRALVRPLSKAVVAGTNFTFQN